MLNNKAPSVSLAYSDGLRFLSWGKVPARRLDHGWRRWFYAGCCRAASRLLKAAPVNKQPGRWHEPIARRTTRSAGAGLSDTTSRGGGPERGECLYPGQPV